MFRLGGLDALLQNHVLALCLALRLPTRNRAMLPNENAPAGELAGEC